MFVFRRAGHGKAETWEILLPEGNNPKLARRFRKALGNGNSDRPQMQGIGMLMAIHRGHKTEVLLGVKNGLNKRMRQTLDGEMRNCSDVTFPSSGAMTRTAGFAGMFWNRGDQQ